MLYSEFLDRIINDGIAEVKECYSEEDQKNKLEGAIAGFEACRGLSTLDLADMLITANKYAEEAYLRQDENYWYFRYYQLQVEWVANVVSALLLNQGLAPIAGHLPTARGYMKAAEIVGTGI